MVDGLILIANVVTMKFDRHGYFMVYLRSDTSIYILTFRNTTFSQNTVLSLSLRRYFVDRCVTQLPKRESNSFIDCMKRDKISCDFLYTFDNLVKTEGAVKLSKASERF